MAAAKLGVFFDEHNREQRPKFPEEHGTWDFDGTDYLLLALLCDNVYCPELLWEDPVNRDAAGMFQVRDYQYPLFRVQTNYAGFACARSTGKALASDEVVLTPDGWSTIAALNVGDLVIGSSGEPTVVIGVYPQGERELFDVEFTDCARVRCDAEHLWYVTCDTWNSPGGRGLKGPRLRRTREIAASRMRYKVPQVKRHAEGSARMVRDTAWRGIANITPAGTGDATCIEVAAADGLFVTRDFVLTHNTESIKAKSFVHTFRRMGEDRLLSAPELIHLLPLTDAIESRINACRLTREFLDTRAGKTGFTHRPFGVNYQDGTALVGRIPRLTGTGVKGMHAPDVTIDEGQDYPEKGWTEIHEVVMKDHVDQDGEPDFIYEFYGVHSGARDTGFYKRATTGGFKVTQITALQRPGWSRSEKEAAKAAYGGTSSPDYRRNIYGEPGAAASPLFVSARLVACMDQDRESNYNQRGYRFQEIRAEEFDELMMPIADVLDLPSGLKRVWAGMDLGLTVAPTVILLFSEEKVGGAMRLKLVRRFHLQRMRTRQIRHALYAIGWHYGEALQGLGIDETGIGFPLFQEMEDDELAPPLMMERTRGYFFNSKVPVGIAPEHVTQDSQGNLRDQYGSSVTKVEHPDGTVQFVVTMPMIEASTRYLREFVDETFLMLPFDPAVIGDMQGDTAQRLKRIIGLKNKPNAYHILDAMRAMAMSYKSEEVESQLAVPQQMPVLELSLDDL